MEPAAVKVIDYSHGTSELLHLAREIEAADRHRALEDHHWIDLSSGSSRGIVGLGAHVEGRLVGFLQVSEDSKGLEFELLVRPRARHLEPSISTALLEQGLIVANQRGAARVSLWVSHPESRTDRLLTSLGFVGDREVIQLRRPLPLEAELGAPELPVRTFEVGRDETAWLEMNNRAFQWHPDQGDWTRETIEQREQEPWFDPGGFLLYEKDGRLQAFCWTKVHSDLSTPVGEIYVIAVDPDLTGSGLGKRILTNGLHHLQNRPGVTSAMLYVEASNDRARALYYRYGFCFDHLDRRYLIRPSQAP